MKKEGKILIIDDNQSVFESLKLFLKYKFAQIETVSKPNQISSKLSQSNFNIILMDMNFSVGIKLFYLFGIDPKRNKPASRKAGKSPSAINYFKRISPIWNNFRFALTLKGTENYLCK